MCASEVGGYLPRVVGPVFLSLFCFCILNVYLLVFAISALLVGDCETLSAHRGVSVWALPLVFMRAHAGGGDSNQPGAGAPRRQAEAYVKEARCARTLSPVRPARDLLAISHIDLL